MKNLILRGCTGIIFVIVLLSGLINQHSFLLIFGLVTALLLWEFYGLINQSGGIKVQRGIASIAGVYLFIATWLYTNGLMNEMIFLPYLLLLMGGFIGELYYKSPNPIGNWAYSLLGQIYCAGSISLLNLFFNKAYLFDNYGSLLVVALFVFIWLNDTGAYLIGSTFGRHRLFERISPKKSWEGFVGGWVFALIGGYALSRLTTADGNPFTLVQWLGLATTVVVFGTWGDLIESLFKRTLKIKDSGNIIPGHGGILDRFDSVILAIPAAYIYIELIIQN